MKYKGKQICNILKNIRLKIADANDINLVTSDCTYKGDCVGTCPKCEAELRYLEQSLNMRRLAGKTVILTGIYAAMFSFSSCSSPSKISSDKISVTDTKKKSPKTYIERLPVKGEISQDEKNKIEVCGIVVDENNEPMIGASIRVKDTDTVVASDINGKFNLSVDVPCTLIFYYIGYEQIEVKIEESCFVHVAFTDISKSIMGEVPVIRIETDDVYNRK